MRARGRRREGEGGTLKKTYTPKGVLFGSVEISTKLCPGVNV